MKRTILTTIQPDKAPEMKVPIVKNRRTTGYKGLPTAAPDESRKHPVRLTPFESAYNAAFTANGSVRFGQETLTYFDKKDLPLPRGAEDLAKHIWTLIGGDKLGDGLIAHYLFQLATQQIERVLKGIVEYARQKFGDEAATMTDETLDRITKIPFDEFKPEFEKILAQMNRPWLQRLVHRIFGWFK